MIILIKFWFIKLSISLDFIRCVYSDRDGNWQYGGFYVHECGILYIIYHYQTCQYELVQSVYECYSKEIRYYLVVQFNIFLTKSSLIFRYEVWVPWTHGLSYYICKLINISLIWKFSWLIRPPLSLVGMNPFANILYRDAFFNRFLL